MWPEVLNQQNFPSRAGSNSGRYDRSSRLFSLGHWYDNLRQKPAFIVYHERLDSLYTSFVESFKNRSRLKFVAGRKNRNLRFAR